MHTSARPSKPGARRTEPEKALTGKPAALGDMLRRLIVGAARQLQPGQSQLSECPPAEQADRLCRDTQAAGPRGEPVADRRTAPIHANLRQGDAAEHHVQVARRGQRQAQPLATQAGLFLLCEEVARISFGVRSSTPGELPHHRVTECQHDARHVGLAPRAQQHRIARQRRHREPELGHVEKISSTAGYGAGAGAADSKDPLQVIARRRRHADHAEQDVLGLPVSGGGTAIAGTSELEPAARHSARLPAQRLAGRSGR